MVLRFEGARIDDVVQNLEQVGAQTMFRQREVPALGRAERPQVRLLDEVVHRIRSTAKVACEPMNRVELQHGQVSKFQLFHVILRLRVFGQACARPGNDSVPLQGRVLQAKCLKIARGDVGAGIAMLGESGGNVLTIGLHAFPD